MYIPSTLPFAFWKKEKWKRPLDTEIRNMIKIKVFCGDVTLEVRTPQRSCSIKN